MSRLSELFRKLYGKPLTETALTLLAKYAGDYAGEFGDLARTIIAAVDDGEITSDEKRLIVRATLKAAAKAAGVSVPGWVIDFVIQHFIAEKRIAAETAGREASDKAA